MPRPVPLVPPSCARRSRGVCSWHWLAHRARQSPCRGCSAPWRVASSCTPRLAVPRATAAHAQCHRPDSGRHRLPAARDWHALTEATEARLGAWVVHKRAARHARAAAATACCVVRCAGSCPLLLTCPGCCRERRKGEPLRRINFGARAELIPPRRSVPVCPSRGTHRHTSRRHHPPASAGTQLLRVDGVESCT